MYASPRAGIAELLPGRMERVEMLPAANFAKGRFSEASNRGYRYQTVSVSRASLAFLTHICRT